MKEKVVIYGGQFNPVHIAHLEVASEVYHTIKPDRFIFLPSYMSPLKAHQTNLNTKHRIKMLELAVKELGFGEISLLEIKREGQSYTYDTINEIKDRNKEADIYFVIGTDQYDQLDKWYNIDALKQIVTFIVVNRDKAKQETTKDMISIQIPRMDISSSMIRERIKANQTIQILVPKNIEEYIKKERLYEN